MLTKFRNNHSKKVLWGLTVIIILAFGLGGGVSLLRGKKKKTAGILNNKKLSASEFDYYTNMARVFLALRTPKEENIDPKSVESLSADFLVLLLKAKKEKIKVTDREVTAYILKNFFPKQKFDKQAYENFIRFLSRRYALNLSSRGFEEYIRGFIMTDKVFDKHINIEVSDEEIKALYLKDTQKAKIAYLAIPYEKFRVEEKIEKEIKDGDDDKTDEKIIEENVKKEAEKYAGEILDEIIKKEISDIKKLSKRKNVDFQITDYFKYYDYIEGLGFDEEVNKIVFSLKNGEVHPQILTFSDAACIIQLRDKTAFDEEEFKEKKEGYSNRVKQGKEMLEKLKFLMQLKKEANPQLAP